MCCTVRQFLGMKLWISPPSRSLRPVGPLPFLALLHSPAAVSLVNYLMLRGPHHSDLVWFFADDVSRTPIVLYK